MTVSVNINAELLEKCGLSKANAALFAEPLAKACKLFGITTPERFAAFIAQARHESANFTRLSENLNYTTAERIKAVFPSKVKTLDFAHTLVKNPQGLANLVYADKLGNGHSESGDGYLFRGRGIFQLTGRWNYADASKATGHDYVNNPDLVSLPEDACLTAAYFWYSKGCNALADLGDLAGITKKVNGPAMLGLKERTEFFALATEALDHA
jgi:putative chitinase